jgi:YbgC/YbaW family acyl-CoA thioester hydrolase
METQTPALSKWPETKMSIRFSDCDLYGHLNNIWYVKYFLDAREDHLADHYGLTLGAFAKLGVGWVVGSNQIAYFKPARVNEQVIVRSALIDFQPDQVLVEMQMLDEAGSHVKSVMWSKFIHVSLKDGKRTPHSEDMMGLFSQIATGKYRDDEFNERMNYLRGTKPAQAIAL